MLSEAITMKPVRRDFVALSLKSTLTAPFRTLHREFFVLLATPPPARRAVMEPTTERIPVMRMPSGID